MMADGTIHNPPPPNTHTHTTALARRLLRDALAAATSSASTDDDEDVTRRRITRERLTYLAMLLEGATTGEGWREPVRASLFWVGF